MPARDGLHPAAHTPPRSLMGEGGAIEEALKGLAWNTALVAGELKRIADTLERVTSDA